MSTSVKISESSDASSPTSTLSSTSINLLMLADLNTEEIEPYIRKTSARPNSKSRKRSRPLDGDESGDIGNDGGDEEEQQVARLRINSRERKRMHDLNSAMDGLRAVMPYAQNANVRKLSKIASLLLARNYIVSLQKQLDDANRLLKQHTQLHYLPPPHSTAAILKQQKAETVLTRKSKSPLSLQPSIPLHPAMPTMAHFPAFPFFPSSLLPPTTPICLRLLGDPMFPCPCPTCAANSLPVLTALPK